MNASNVKNARPKVSGVFFSAPIGTTLPTDATTALGSTFVELGYVSEDGITQTIDRQNKEIKEMGGEVVLTINESHTLSYKLKPLELSTAVWKEIFGDANVTAETGGDIASAKMVSDELPQKVFVFDMRIGGGRLMRIVLPRGQVTSIGDMPYKKGEVIASELTISASPDTSGVKGYYYFATPTSPDPEPEVSPEPEPEPEE